MQQKWKGQQQGINVSWSGRRAAPAEAQDPQEERSGWINQERHMLPRAHKFSLQSEFHEKHNTVCFFVHINLYFCITLNFLFQPNTLLCYHIPVLLLWDSPDETTVGRKEKLASADIFLFEWAQEEMQTFPLDLLDALQTKPSRQPHFCWVSLWLPVPAFPTPHFSSCSWARRSLQSWCGAFCLLWLLPACGKEGPELFTLEDQRSYQSFSLASCLLY